MVLIAGKYKEKALASALRGGLCNVLVTDDETATRLLSNAA
jgi:DNA-binding transcriptional regulator LsrR (DeoR family)